MTEEWQDSSAEAKYGRLPQNRGSAPISRPGAPAIPKESPGGALAEMTDALPVYTTLPANAGNFTIGQTSSSATSSATKFVCFTYTVPQGYVLMATSFILNVEDTFSAGSSPSSSLGIPTSTLSVNLYVNKASKPFTQGIVIQPLDGAYPCTIIARGGDIVTIAVTYDYTGVTTPPGNVVFVTHLMGQMLLQNKLATQYTALKPVTMQVKNV